MTPYTFTLHVTIESDEGEEHASALFAELLDSIPEWIWDEIVSSHDVESE